MKNLVLADMEVLKAVAQYFYGSETDLSCVKDVDIEDYFAAMAEEDELEPSEGLMVA